MALVVQRTPKLGPARQRLRKFFRGQSYPLLPSSPFAASKRDSRDPIVAGLLELAFYLAEAFGSACGLSGSRTIGLTPVPS
jgi:hypothetical protein